MTYTKITKEDISPSQLEWIGEVGIDEFLEGVNKRRARDAGWVDDSGDDGDDDSAKVKPFPVEALPKPVAKLVQEGALEIGCPPDMVGLPLLVVMGSAIGNSRTINVRGKWNESACLWATVVARPGDKKTPGANLALKPAHMVGKRLRNEFRKQHDDWRKQMRLYNADVKRAKGDNYDVGPEPLEPTLKRTVVNDTTLEQLMVILDGNPRGVVQYRDELDGWFRAMDQYKTGKGADRQTWLELWSSSPVAVDRKGSQESIALDRPFVSLYGTIQPEVLPELGDRKDGLLDRFLYAYPERVPRSWSDHEISDESERQILELYEALRNLEMERDEFGEPVPKRVHFTPEARELFKQIFNEHDSEMNALGFPEQLEGPWAKLEGYFARITLLLAIMRNTLEGSTDERIEQGDVLRASVLLDYFKSHARKVFTDPSNMTREDLLAKDLALALEKNDGTLEGEPEEVWMQIESDHKPSRSNEFTKDLLKIAKKRNGSLVVERGWRGRDNDKRRTLKVFLKNVVPVDPVVHNQDD